MYLVNYFWFTFDHFYSEQHFLGGRPCHFLKLAWALNQTIMVKLVQIHETHDIIEIEGQAAKFVFYLNINIYVLLQLKNASLLNHFELCLALLGNVSMHLKLQKFQPIFSLLWNIFRLNFTLTSVKMYTEEVSQINTSYWIVTSFSQL